MSTGDGAVERSSGVGPDGADLGAARRQAVERAGTIAGEIADWWAELQAAAESTMTRRSLDRLFRQALGTIRDAMGADAVSLLVANQAGDELVARASVGLVDDVSQGVRIASGHGVAGRVMAERRAVIVGDLSTVEVASPVLRQSGLRSLVAVPILGPDRMLGVLHADSFQSERFDRLDAEILQLVADRLAAAIQRVGLFEDERRARASAVRTADRLSRLQRISSALSETLDVDAIASVVLTEVVGELGPEAVTRSLWLCDESTSSLRLVPSSDPEGTVDEALWDMPLDAALPGPATVRSCRPVWASTRQALMADFPALGDQSMRGHAFAVLPMVVDRRALGALAFGFAGPRTFEPDTREFLGAVASQCAQAVQRALLFAQERAARARLQLLADVTELTSSSLDPARVVEEVVELVAGRLADACVVMVPAATGLHRQVTRGTLPVSRRLARRLQSDVDIPFDADVPAAVAFRTGATQVAELGRPGSARSDPANDRAVDRRTGRAVDRAWVVAVPMKARGEVIGVMSFVLGAAPAPAGSEHPTIDEAISLFGEVTGRTGVALDNANRYQHQRDVAEVLQRAVLPEQLPAVAGMLLDAEYRAGTTGTYAGGDWYDAIVLPGGRLFFSVGDVMGKGPAAAALMGQLRSATRVYAISSQSPAAVLAGLDRLFAALEEERLVTLVAGIVDPSTGELILSSAGHPPPLLVHPDGTSEYIEDGRTLILGSGAHAPARREHRCHLLPGDTLVLYSDGLVERRGQGLAAGLDLLAAAAGEQVRRNRWPAAAPSRALLEDLTAEHPATDDVAVLTLCWSGPPPPAATLPDEVAVRLRLAGGVASTGRARHWLTRQLAGVPEGTAATAALLMSELVTNAVLYTAGEITVWLRRARGAIRVEVVDGSPVVPVVTVAPVDGRSSFDAPTGRGLRLVEALASDWGVAQRPTGKAVWFQLDLFPGGPPPGAERRGLVEIRLLGLPIPELVAAQETYREQFGEFRRIVDGDPGQSSAIPGRLLALVQELGTSFSGFTQGAEARWRAARDRGEAELDLDLWMPTGVGGACERYDLLLDEADQSWRDGNLLTVAATPGVVAFRKWVLWEVIRQAGGLAPTRWRESSWCTGGAAQRPGKSRATAR